MSFISWYYSIAIHRFFAIWKNIFFFVWEFFSFFDLLKTVFAPWHRDIRPKTWRGFQPQKSLRRLVENMMSRFIGGMVRIIVLSWAIFSATLVVIFGFVWLCIWLGVPVLFFLGIFFFWYSWVFGFFFFLAISQSIFALWCFFESKKTLPSQKDLTELSRERFFDRVLARVDLEREDISKEVFVSREQIVDFLDRKNIRMENFLVGLEWEVLLEEGRIQRGRFWSREQLMKTQGIGKSWKYGYTPELDNVSEDFSLTTPFHSMYVCSHRKSLELLSLVLSRPNQNSALIIGQPGVGKKSVVRWLVKDIYDRRIGGGFREMRFLRLNIERVIGGHGSDVKRSLNELEYLFYQSAFAGNIILIVDDIDYYLGDSAIKNANPDITPILEKYLPLPSFRMIATVSTEKFHENMERNRSILKGMEKIEIEEISQEEALRVLLDHYADREKRYVVFTVKALRHIIKQSSRFNPNIPLPERAIDFAEEVLVYWQSHGKKRRIDSHLVDEYITLKTGIPVGSVSENEKEKLLHIEDRMKERIVGQKKALSFIAKSLQKARSELSSSTRPIGSFLFLGPTGVGKTETAKVLAKTFFGGDANMIRLDMSEFQSFSALHQLIGSRETGNSGRLTGLIQDNPYGVLLLDELEKAHSSILDIFLQILDEGFFTDAFGTKVYFNNLIIIATSNAGSSQIKEYFEKNSQETNIIAIEKEIIDTMVRDNIFRVEFLNRFDGIVFFSPLSQEELLEVTTILLREFAEGAWKNKRIHIEFEEDVAGLVVRYGYDGAFGARSLRRFIADNVESLISDMVISQDIGENGKIFVRTEDVERAFRE
jgi:ATP-dependent Clp protease ATP-binding subunit ClpA